MPKQITVKEALKMYDIPLWTLRNYVSRRLIPIRKKGNRVYLETNKLGTWLKQFDIAPDTMLSPIRGYLKYRKRGIYLQMILRQVHHLRRMKTGRKKVKEANKIHLVRKTKGQGPK